LEGIVGKLPQMLNVNLIRAVVAERLKQKKLSMKKASLDAGLGETYVRDLLKRNRHPRAVELGKLAVALDLTVSELSPKLNDKNVAEDGHIPHYTEVDEPYSNLARGDMDSLREQLIKKIPRLSDKKVVAMAAIALTDDENTRRPTQRDRM
jgi:transcriptional regulator with XRE-family HTH domain